MNRVLFYTACTALMLLGACMRPSPEYTTAEEFDKIKAHPEMLLGFFDKMPKGGELHHHAIGSVFAENLIEVAVDAGCYINPRTLEVYKDESQALNQVVPDTE